MNINSVNIDLDQAIGVVTFSDNSVIHIKGYCQCVAFGEIVWNYTYMKDKLQHEKDYVEFLEKRLKSSHFKKNVSPEEFEKTEKKLKKARLVLRVLEK
jgi:hypothetical protein